MNKKIISALVAVLLILPTYSAQALKSGLRNSNINYNVAILDTAINSSSPQFGGRIVHEVCILEWNSCPNGTSFMEGFGSANLPNSIMSRNGFDHGAKMTSVFLSNNIASGVIFIRIIGNTPAGARQIANEKTVVQALDWVIANKDKFNIGAVSMSQGHHNLATAADYCPTTVDTKSRIQALSNANVPFFVATGNDRDQKRIDWPSCIEEAIAVGASNSRGILNSYSNFDSARTDYLALGEQAYRPFGGRTTVLSGTSASTQVAVANWLTVKNAKPTLTYQQLKALIDSTSTQSSAKIINVQKALL